MAIKRSAGLEPIVEYAQPELPLDLAEEPKPVEQTQAQRSVQRLKRITNSSDEGRTTKEELVGKLLIITLREYDPAYKGQYEVQPKAVLDLIDVDTQERYSQFWVFGNLAKQVFAKLDINEGGVGRIISGIAPKSGRPFFGVDWTESDEDFNRAEALLETVPPF